MFSRCSRVLNFRVALNFKNSINGVTLRRDQFSTSSQLCRKRFYNHKPWPNDWLPFKWQRPEEVPGYFQTDDPLSTEGLPKFDANKLQPHFEAVEELKNAPEDVKKQFTIGNLRRQEILSLLIDENQKNFARHQFDEYSYEAKVFRYTLKVRSALQQLRKNPNSATLKSVVNCWNGKRRKFLKLLYRTNKARYEWIVKELNIKNTPPPPGVCESERLERKKELRRLTAEYCENIRKQKLNEYHEKLKAEQLRFAKEKEETEKWITTTLKIFNLKDPRSGEIV